MIVSTMARLLESPSSKRTATMPPETSKEGSRCGSAMSGPPRATAITEARLPKAIPRAPYWSQACGSLPINSPRTAPATPTMEAPTGIADATNPPESSGDQLGSGQRLTRWMSRGGTPARCRSLIADRAVNVSGYWVVSWMRPAGMTVDGCWGFMVVSCWVGLDTRCEIPANHFLWMLVVMEREGSPGDPFSRAPLEAVAAAARSAARRAQDRPPARRPT